jgi:hypothetical protein
MCRVKLLFRSHRGKEMATRNIRTIAGEVEDSRRGTARYPRIHAVTPITHLRRIRRTDEIRPWKTIEDWAACDESGAMLTFGPLTPRRDELGYAVPGVACYWCLLVRGFHRADDCDVLDNDVLTSAQAHAEAGV